MSATMTRRKQDAEINLECTQVQKDSYIAAAERDGRTLSSWVRHQLDLAASRSGVKRGQHLPEFPKEGE